MVWCMIRLWGSLDCLLLDNLCYYCYQSPPAQLPASASSGTQPRDTHSHLCKTSHYRLVGRHDLRQFAHAHQSILAWLYTSIVVTQQPPVTAFYCGWFNEFSAAAGSIVSTIIHSQVGASQGTQRSAKFLPKLRPLTGPSQ